MESKHKKLYHLLKAEILGGKYRKTQSFPSETQLARRYAYSRTTIRKALDELRHEGFVRSSQGKGTRVTELALTKTFGLILPGVSRYEYFQPIATELSRIAQENHCAFLFSNVDALETNQLKRHVRELAANFIKRQVTGVIYHPIEFPSKGDVLYGANKTGKGWWLWTINNRGVTKWTDTEARVDPTAAAKVSVDLKAVRAASVRELVTGRDVSVRDGRFDFTVPAGELAVFEIAEK